MNIHIVSIRYLVDESVRKDKHNMHLEKAREMFLVKLNTSVGFCGVNGLVLL